MYAQTADGPVFQAGAGIRRRHPQGVKWGAGVGYDDLSSAEMALSASITAAELTTWMATAHTASDDGPTSAAKSVAA